MPESLVKPPHGLSLDMVVANRNPFPVHLKKGTVLGRVEPAILANEEEIVGDTSGAEGSPEQPPEEETHVAALSEQGTQNRQRLQELIGLLPLKLDHLSEEYQKLMKCLEANTDVFALNATELGITSLVSHAIDTGESKPIRQGPQRTPFALRKTVDQMVEYMLTQGVVEESQNPWASPIVLVKKKEIIAN